MRAALILRAGGLLVLLAGLGSLAQPAGYVGRKLSNVAGPFRSVVERFEQCPGQRRDHEDLGDAVILNVTRVSRQWGARAPPQRLGGNLTLTLPLDDSSSTLLTIDKWSNNQWKRNAFVMRLPAACSALRGLGLLPPADSTCPAQEGVYSFRNVAADWQFVSMPQFYYGTWRAEAVFGRPDGTRLGCVRLLFKTSPAYPEDWPAAEDAEEDDAAGGPLLAPLPLVEVV